MKKQQPIRVLHVVTSMNRAGLETMLMNYYRHIDRSKVQFDFLVHRSEKADYDDEIKNLGGKIHYFSPITISSMPGYPSKMKQFLLEHPEYKIVHSHLDALSALPLNGANRAGVPVRIAHSHVNGFSKDSKYILRQIMKQKILKYATDLFACSKSAGDFMFGKNSGHTVMKNAIDISKYAFSQVTRDDARKELGLDGRFVVGHVGRFAHPKNHSFLIDIFYEVVKKKENATLLLVGTGELEDQVKSKVEERGLSKKVLFLGVRSDISDLMQAMDVFVLPSHYEGLGIVAVEAQAAALPCVLSNAVSNEAEIAPGLVKFLDIESGEGDWVDAILGAARGAHIERSYFTNAGYDIDTEALKYVNYCDKSLGLVEQS